MARVIIAAMLALGAFALAPARAQDRVAEVRATCVDAQGAPHPASQTFAEREAAADFEGELFRCLAGTRLRYDVDHAVHDCAAGEALWFGEGALSCRAAAEHPREHDRDLLRRFRAGAKLVWLAAVEAPPPPPANPYPYRRNN
jgi:hypothetical protein